MQYINGNATLDIVDIRPGTLVLDVRYITTLGKILHKPALNSHGVQCIDFEERGDTILLCL